MDGCYDSVFHTIVLEPHFETLNISISDPGLVLLLGLHSLIQPEPALLAFLIRRQVSEERSILVSPPRLLIGPF